MPQGANVLLAVAVTGTPTPIIQWKKNNANLGDGSTGNGSTIAGSAAGTLTINNAQPADGGNYSAGITNSAGTTNSSVAQLIVVAPATGGQSPQLSGGAGGVSFTALAGYRYLVLGSTNIGSAANWVSLTNLPPTFSDHPFSFTDGQANPRNFYRTFMTNN